MKNIFLIVILLITAEMKSQVAIGKSSVTNSSCLLEFGNSSNRGIALPKVENVTTMNASEGTLAWDTATGSFRYYGGTTPAWSSPVSGGTIGGAPSGSDENGKKMIIGADKSTADGILILEATEGNKALLLPLVNQPAQRFSSPPTGLMVYDTATNQIAVFNGTKWTYF
ncbi:hypothetical protein [Chryseobacterium pennipullorum]|uniref:Uncharacterized protein n=1 Tax=Chryseobacterium pennipullorum TaxID=2258963 RepID=A0A3D9BAM1_9FLAO|nr:hypothetical protein [Chryseobacterium pennipullorum]REC50306.1 hypothetical protein DRF67_01905 [Chryseobacterium pennipullorum]